MGIYKSKKNRTLSKLSKKKTMKRNSRKSFSRKMRGGGGLIRTPSGRIVYSPNAPTFMTAARNLKKPQVISLNPLNPVIAAQKANKMARAAKAAQAPQKVRH